MKGKVIFSIFAQSNLCVSDVAELVDAIFAREIEKPTHTKVVKV